MATFDVTEVHRESQGYHRHIVGVWAAGVYKTNREVVDSINAGNVWQTKVTGEKPARIRPMNLCGIGGASCPLAPYLTTNPDHSQKNNLESLPER